MNLYPARVKGGFITHLLDYQEGVTNRGSAALCGAKPGDGVGLRGKHRCGWWLLAKGVKITCPKCMSKPQPRVRKTPQRPV